MASDELFKGLKCKRSAAKGTITRCINHIRNSMLNKDVQHVKSYINNEFEDANKHFLETHTDFHLCLTEQDDIEDSEKYRREVAETIQNFRDEVDTFLADHEGSEMFEHNSPSQIGSQSSTTSSILAARAAAAARKASLMAEAEMFSQTLDLELQELKLSQKRKEMELNKKIAEASAIEKVYSESSTPTHARSINSPLSSVVGQRIHNPSTNLVSNQSPPNVPVVSTLSTSVSVGQVTQSSNHGNVCVSTPVPGVSKVNVSPSGNANKPRLSWGTSTIQHMHDKDEQSMMDTYLLHQQSLIETISLPKAELSVFDGDPLKYHPFITSFKNAVDKETISNTAKLTRPLQYCSGKARSLLDCCLVKEPSEGYTLALKLLKDRFGNVHTISRAWIKTVMDRPKVSDSDDLLEFADLLTVCKETLSSLGYIQEISNLSSLHALVSKLPYYLQQRWLRINYEIKQSRAPSIDDVVQFIKKAALEANDPVFGNMATQSRPKSVVQKSKKIRSSHSVNVEVKDSQPTSSQPQTKPPCAQCSQDHFLTRCPTFKALSVKDRCTFVKSKKLCLNCFKSGHFVRDCKREFTCTIDSCGQKHNKMLHLPRSNATVANVLPVNDNIDPVNDTVVDNTSGQANPRHASYAGSTNCNVALPTLPVRVKNPETLEYIDTYALLDSGSTQTFCSDSLIEQLDLPHKNNVTDVTTIQGTAKVCCKMVKFVVSSIDDLNELLLSDVVSRPSLGVNLPDLVSYKKWPHLVDIHIPSIDCPEVQLIIGQDFPSILAPIEVVTGKLASEPYATKTSLGWTINGPISQHLPYKINSFFVKGTITLDEQVERFWEIENPKATMCMSVNDKRVVESWNNTIDLVDGHFTLGIPFKVRPPPLENNISMAKHRLNLLRKKFVKNEDLKVKYFNNIESLIDKGYAEPVPKMDASRVWYIPHHSVVHPKKGKLRVVFDCAAKFSGSSLNDHVLQGPDLTNLLIGVLLRFRSEPVAFVADIESMYHQVKVSPEDRDMLRFLWFKKGDTAMLQEPDVYRMTSHLFGGIWSPSAANFALHKCTEWFGDYDPDVLATILKNFYVDDCLKSVSTDSRAIGLIGDLIEILTKGGFKLTKFLSSSANVLNAIPEELRASNVSSTSLELCDITPTERALGVLWDTKGDVLKVETNVVVKPSTKRGLLSTMSSVYDPLGVVSPFVFKAKLLFQELCRRKLDWDQEIPNDLNPQWLQWLSDLQLLNDYSISRCIKPMVVDSTTQLTLHYFSDASSVGYGTVVYLRVENSYGIHCSFVMAKAKLAPLKSTTIPRLELLAATEAAKVTGLIETELQLPLDSSVFWSDSMIVLWYIKNTDKRYQTFVANRVASILETTTANQWRHVGTHSNPADHASRGLSATELLQCRDFKHGPDFLWKPEDQWPNEKDCPDKEIDGSSLELKKDIQVYTSPMTGESPLSKLYAYYSSWFKLKRAVAWLVRIKDMLLKRTTNVKQLDLKDIKLAEVDIFKDIQRSLVHDIKRLCPIQSESGILLVGGRVDKAHLSFPERHQIILPHDHVVTKLIVRECHVKVGHGGIERTLAETRTRFWIVKGRKAVKSCKFKCVTCKKLQAKPASQLMASLPPDRVNPTGCAFKHVGIDYFGPFLVKVKRSQVKRYGCIFTCLTTRAIHIEVSHSLSTDSFINALQRFIARRGLPELIRSDNGSNFKGAESELCQAKIGAFLHGQSVEWKFNPPYASNFGGVWERQIRTIRRVLNALFNTQSLDDEGLLTALTVVEGIINSRPITKVSDDPNDLAALTPNHLLLLREGPISPPGLFVKQDLYLKRWRQIQYMCDLFWKRWIREYLPSLQECQKWIKPQYNLQTGDIVLLMDMDTIRYKWPLGKVISTSTSDDGFVRSARVKTQSGTYDRPINKLCLLESALY